MFLSTSFIYTNVHKNCGLNTHRIKISVPAVAGTRLQTYLYIENELEAQCNT